jgi:hypothetical protein
MTARKILREPLFHFFLLGALLFAVYAVLNRNALDAPDEIRVDGARIEALRTQFERVWQRPPDPAELQGLIDNWVSEEMRYREGLALGFEADDPVVRRRVAQKVTFMTEALVDDTVSDAELADWLQEHPERYRVEPRISLRQVYFDPARHEGALEDDVSAALAELEANEHASPGDVSLLPSTIESRSLSDVVRSFGRGFASEVFELPVGAWSGPVRSGFGVHLVRVEAIVPGRAAELEEIREALARDVVAERRKEAADAFDAALRERYKVIMEDIDVSAAAGNP